MFTSIHIQGYRIFNRFDMSGLGRVNLLVGMNNSGKTSVLEALHLLTSRGDTLALWQLLWRRGERLQVETNARRGPQAELDVAHLFAGHELRVGANFMLSAKNQSPEQSITYSIVRMEQQRTSDQLTFDDPSTSSAQPSRLALQITGKPTPIHELIPLTRLGGIRADDLDIPSRRPIRGGFDAGQNGNPSQFITTDSIDSQELLSLWDRVVLTKNEDLVLQALISLDKGIVRIAGQVGNAYYGGHTRGGFMVLREDTDAPIPIGSMGDGMWRMLAMAIAITQCKGGVLLIDEIDTGLHFTVMADMWRLILRAATSLNVQVFATTHSFDCVSSLAKVSTEDRDLENCVTLQRIESGRPKAVPYSDKEIFAAAKAGVEVR